MNTPRTTQMIRSVDDIGVNIPKVFLDFTHSLERELFEATDMAERMKSAWQSAEITITNCEADAYTAQHKLQAELESVRQAAAEAIGRLGTKNTDLEATLQAVRDELKSVRKAGKEERDELRADLENALQELGRVRGKLLMEEESEGL